MKTAKVNVDMATRFLCGCIAEAEADGYQQMEDGNQVADDPCPIPDDWSHDGNVILLRFGKTTFRATVILH